MNKSDIIEIVDDRLEKRFESYAQSQIKLHQEYHDKLLAAVESQIKNTVNGKIDKLNEKTDRQDIILERLDKSIQPFEYTRSWFVSFKDGVSWVAGFITPFGVIGGAIWFIFNIIK